MADVGNSLELSVEWKDEKLGAINVVSVPVNLLSHLLAEKAQQPRFGNERYRSTEHAHAYCDAWRLYCSLDALTSSRGKCSDIYCLLIREVSILDRSTGKGRTMS